MNITGLKIPTGGRQTSWLFTSMTEELNQGPLRNNSSLVVRAGLEPPDFKSGALTTRPRCLPVCLQMDTRSLIITLNSIEIGQDGIGLHQYPFPGLTFLILSERHSVVSARTLLTPYPCEQLVSPPPQMRGNLVRGAGETNLSHGILTQLNAKLFRLQKLCISFVKCGRQRGA